MEARLPALAAGWKVGGLGGVQQMPGQGIPAVHIVAEDTVQCLARNVAIQQNARNRALPQRHNIRHRQILHLIEELRQKGVRVPEDVAVCGYDDYRFATLSKPALTTYRVDVERMAAAAVGQLLRKLRQEHTEPEKIPPRIAGPDRYGNTSLLPPYPLDFVESLCFCSPL